MLQVPRAPRTHAQAAPRHSAPRTASPRPPRASPASLFLRLDLLEAEGVKFACGVDVGGGVPVSELKAQHDALLLAVGSTTPNDLKIPGRSLEGVRAHTSARLRAPGSRRGRCWSWGRVAVAVAARVAVLLSRWASSLRLPPQLCSSQPPRPPRSTPAPAPLRPAPLSCAQVHFAMEFLRRNQYALFTDREGALKSHWTGEKIDAKGKHVVVIGGGDTGTDCIGTSLRMHCQSLTNFELFPRPPDARGPQNPWPAWPRIYRTDYGHEEAAHLQGADPRCGARGKVQDPARQPRHQPHAPHLPAPHLLANPIPRAREYSILSKEFLGDEHGKLRAIKTVNIRVEAGRLVELEGSEKEWPCDLVILAMGFKSPEATIAQQLSLELDARSNYKAQYGQYATSADGVFAAGDCRRGQARAAARSRGPQRALRGPCALEQPC